jgi:hypothetical protein
MLMKVGPLSIEQSGGKGWVRNHPALFEPGGIMFLCTAVLSFLVLHSGGQIDRNVLYLDRENARIEERIIERRKLQGEKIKNVKTTYYAVPFDCKEGPGDR